MTKKFVLPLDSIEVLDGELEMVFGGFVAMPYGATGGQGCGCGCSGGSGCGCECIRYCDKIQIFLRKI